MAPLVERREAGVLVVAPAGLSADIRTETVPVLGRVTCHRLMLPQLRGALQEVADAGLAGTLHTHDGCYAPRFIERDPSARSRCPPGASPSTWTARPTTGAWSTRWTRVVGIFTLWDFRWGGDRRYPDPVQFELGTLTEPPG